MSRKESKGIHETRSRLYESMVAKETSIRLRGGGRPKSRRRDTGRTSHHKGMYTDKPFISWDGEAAGDGTEAQDYCLIGNSFGGELITYKGYLETADILNFMLDEGTRLEGAAIHVAFSFNYDANHIIRNLPFPLLRQIHRSNTVFYGNYRIEWYPGKWFSVSHKPTGRYICIYDTFGFWHTSLIRAIESDPILVHHPDVERIRAGKIDRGTFRHNELDSKVVPYFRSEIELHRQLMENLRQTLRDANLVPRKWYGPSAIISEVYRRSNLKHYMNRPVSDFERTRRRKNGRQQTPDTILTYTLPDEVNRVARWSFAGGRFEQFRIGYYEGPVYGYDITSAYPHAMLSLPSLRDGQWRHVTGKELGKLRDGDDELPFGFYHLTYNFIRAYKLHHGSQSSVSKWVMPSRPPHPLFRRDEYGRVCYPWATEGWHPAHSASMLAANRGTEFLEAWIFDPTYEHLRPFHREGLDFQEMFTRRQEYKDDGRQDLAYALKITLNSGYGKTAQRKGVELGDNLPTFHQIEWAGHITDHCRAKIYQAAMGAWDNGGLIAIETDAVYSTIPLGQDSPGLGGWKAEIYEGICYLQNGVYFTKQDGEWSFHFRGIDRDSLTIDGVREHLHNIEDWSEPWPSVYGTTHTFNSIGYSGVSITGPKQFDGKWLRWNDGVREIRLGTEGLKRIHRASECDACKHGISPAKGLHDLVSPRQHQGVSHPRKDAWIEDDGTEWFDERAEDRWS